MTTEGLVHNLWDSFVSLVQAFSDFIFSIHLAYVRILFLKKRNKTGHQGLKSPGGCEQELWRMGDGVYQVQERDRKKARRRGREVDERVQGKVSPS